MDSVWVFLESRESSSTLLPPPGYNGAEGSVLSNDGKELRMDWLTVIGVLGGWILLQYVILPKLGVPT